MIKDLQSVSLLDILPPNLLHDEAVRAAAKALDDELQKVTKATAEVLHLPRLEELPEKVVDLLAWQWHVDFYEPALPLPNKRTLVRRSIDWHRRKGTPYAVEGVVSAALGESKIKEWFEYGGRPYFFRMVHDISNGTEDVNKTTLAQLKQAIWMGKNVRSWLEMLEFHVHLHDKVEYSEELSTISASLAFQDWMPYGNRLWVPGRDGSLYRGGIICRDASFDRDDEVSHDGIIPGRIWERGGRLNLEMDEFSVAARFSFFDDVSESDIMRDGRICHNGRFQRGPTLQPYDEKLSVSFYTRMEEEADPEDGNGKLSIAESVTRRGDFRHDGTAERGDYPFEDDLDGSLSLIALGRSEKYCRDGTMERAADGRLIAV